MFFEEIQVCTCTLQVNLQATFGKIVLDSGSGLRVHFVARIIFLGFLFVMFKLRVLNFKVEVWCFIFYHLV